MVIRFVTRWALTSGIRTVEGEYYDNKSYFSGKWKDYSIFVSAKEAFETLAGAKEEARRMAKKRASRLMAQAKKLSDPKWEPKVR